MRKHGRPAKVGDRRFLHLEARLDKSDAETHEQLQKQDTEIAEIKVLMVDKRVGTKAMTDT